MTIEVQDAKPPEDEQLRRRETVLMEAGIIETENSGNAVGQRDAPVTVAVVNDDDETKEDDMEANKANHLENEKARTVDEAAALERKQHSIGAPNQQNNTVTEEGVEVAPPPQMATGGTSREPSSSMPPSARRQESRPGAVAISRGSTDMQNPEQAPAATVTNEDGHLVQAELVPHGGGDSSIERVSAVAVDPHKERKMAYMGICVVLVVVTILVVALVGRENGDGSGGEGSTPIEEMSYTESLYLGNSIIGTSAFDRFGDPVAFSSDGTILAIGARGNGDVGANSGMVRVYTTFDRSAEEILDSSDLPSVEGISWRQLGNALWGENPGDQFAHSGMAMSGSGRRIAVGSPFYNATGPNSTILESAGNVRVFELRGERWSQVGQNVPGLGAGDGFGRAIAMSEDGTIFAGSSTKNNENGNFSGTVMAFRQSTTNDTIDWEPMGQIILGRDHYDRIGRSMSMSADGMRLALGSTEWNGHDFPGYGAGFVSVYDFNGTHWVQVGQDIVGDSDQDIFGRDTTISANGAVVACGANLGETDNGPNSGYSRVFQYDSESDMWVQLGQTIVGDNEDDNLGVSVALTDDGFRFATGARQKGFGLGYVRVYDYDVTSDKWVQAGRDLVGETLAAQFGADIQISSNGASMVVGSPFSDVNGDNSGQVQVFNLTNLD